MHVVLSHQVWSNRYRSTWALLPQSPSWMPLLAFHCCRTIFTLEYQPKSFLSTRLRHGEASATPVISIEGRGLSGLSCSECRNSWAINAHFSLSSGHGPTPSLVIQGTDGRENSIVSPVGSRGHYLGFFLTTPQPPQDGRRLAILSSRIPPGGSSASGLNGVMSRRRQNH